MDNIFWSTVINVNVKLMTFTDIKRTNEVMRSIKLKKKIVSKISKQPAAQKFGTIY